MFCCINFGLIRLFPFRSRRRPRLQTTTSVSRAATLSAPRSVVVRTVVVTPTFVVVVLAPALELVRCRASCCRWAPSHSFETISHPSVRICSICSHPRCGHVGQVLAVSLGSRSESQAVRIDRDHTAAVTQNMRDRRCQSHSQNCNTVTPPAFDIYSLYLPENILTITFPRAYLVFVFVFA